MSRLATSTFLPETATIEYCEGPRQIHCCVHLSTVCNQEGTNSRFPPVDGVEQGRRSVCIPNFDVCALISQKSDCLQIARLNRKLQRRRAVFEKASLHIFCER